MDFAPIASVAALFIILMAALGRHALRSGTNAAAPPNMHAALAQTAGRFAARAWGTVEDASAMSLELDPPRLERLSSEQIVQFMLVHVARVACGLAVPMMVPRIESVVLPAAAGRFQDVDGWVRIQVDFKFFDRPRHGTAVLAHELSHYVLNANGIRIEPREANERLTDVAMFVLGLGKVFLAGYQSGSEREYRAGHRLGYLRDDEYAFLDRYVTTPRASRTGLKTRGQVASDRLATMIPDPTVRGHLIQHARLRFPTMAEAEIVERVIDEYIRDRR
jgi:hypothetical protein